MKNSIFITAILCLFLSLSASAQKIGHINSLKIMQDLPAVKQADASYEAYGTQLQKQLESRYTALQTKRQNIMNQMNAGQLSQIQISQYEKEIQTEGLELQKMEVDMSKKLDAKRQELFEPINAKVQAAIDAVASENGFTYILDLGSGSVLFSKPANDLTTLVLNKLGL